MPFGTFGETAAMVRCELLKWDGRLNYGFGAELLGRDEHGTWLGVAPHTPFVGPESPGVWNDAFVICVPEADWWIASFYGAGSTLRMEHYIDITTIAEWPDESALSCVDLDLDVARFFDGRIELLDEDEFDEHRVEMDYPDDVVRRARATAQLILEAVESRTEPFDTVGAQWLATLT